jgi:hypothetical protein
LTVSSSWLRSHACSGFSSSSNSSTTFTLIASVQASRQQQWQHATEHDAPRSQSHGLCVRRQTAATCRKQQVPCCPCTLACMHIAQSGTLYFSMHKSASKVHIVPCFFSVACNCMQANMLRLVTVLDTHTR